MLSSCGKQWLASHMPWPMYILLGNWQGKEIIQYIGIYVYLIFPMSVMFYFVSSLGIRYTYIESNIWKCIDYISVHKEVYHIHIPKKCFLIYQIKALPQDKDFHAHQICPLLPQQRIPSALDKGQVWGSHTPLPRWLPVCSSVIRR